MQTAPPHLPDKLAASFQEPDLSLLPPEVANKIEDMWKVDGMIYNFVRSQVELELLKSRFKQAEKQILALCKDKSLTIDNNHEISKIFFDTSCFEFELDVCERTRQIDDEYKVNFSISTSMRESCRLAFEMALVLLHSALEKTGEKKNIFNECPLLNCLCNLRNLVVHIRDLPGIESRICHLQSSDGDGFGPKIILNDAWYISVTPTDFEATENSKRIPHEITDWFINRICSNHCLWHIQQSAIEQLCGYYDARQMPAVASKNQ